MNGLGLLNPAGLFTIAAIAVLIALYFYDRRRRMVPIATMFLWQRIPPHPLQRERFRPDGLFLLRLAILALLIAAYARPFVESDTGASGGAPLVVVLDTSASMQARERDGSRFDLARARIATYVGALERGDEAMLITAAERPHVVQRWSADHGSFRARLAALEPSDTPTNLAPAIELALGEARARPTARVAVLTDLPPEASGVTPTDLARLDYLQIGETDDNLGITSVTVDRPPFRAPRDAVVTAFVRNYGATPRDTVVEARIGGELWDRRTLAIASRATEPIVLTQPPRAGELTVSLLTDDALAVDDRAAAWISDGEPLDLLLVTDSRELAAAFGDIAAAVPGSKVEVVNRAAYEKQLPAGRRVALVDGYVPKTMPPAVNVLYVAPPPGNTVCPATRMVEGAAVIDWELDHPAVAGLGALQALEVGRTSELESPTWGSAVVLAASRRRAFPLLVAGDHDGRRTACLGAELAAPLASSDRLPLLVLTLSALRWLAEPYAGTAITIATGAPVVVARGPTEPVRGPSDGRGLRVIGDPPVLLAERAGVYAMGPRGGERLVFANLFDDRESDIGRANASEFPAAPRDETPLARGRAEISWWLYVAALAALALEWAVWTRRRTADTLAARAETTS